MIRGELGLSAAGALVRDVAGVETPVALPPGTVAGAGGGATFIYKQGGTDSGNVYNTFAKAVTAAQAALPATILIDDSLGSPVTVAGTYNLERIALSGGVGRLGPTLNLAVGTIFQNLNYVYNAYLVGFNTASEIFTAPAGVTWNLVLDGGAALQTDTTATKSFIHVPATSTLVILMRDLSLLQALGSQAVITAVAGGTLQVYLYTGSYYNDLSFTGAGDIDVSVLTQSGTQGVTQTGATDYVVTFVENANQEKYTPTTAGDWPVVPTNTQEALDLLAARVAALEP